jgi:acetyl-CoA acetyltransferase
MNDGASVAAGVESMSDILMTMRLPAAAINKMAAHFHREFGDRHPAPAMVG